MDADAKSHRDYSRGRGCRLPPIDGSGRVSGRGSADRVPLEFLTAPEVAELLHVSTRLLIRWRVEGVGPKWAKPGKNVIYKRSDVEAWIDAHTR